MILCATYIVNAVSVYSCGITHFSPSPPLLAFSPPSLPLHTGTAAVAMWTLLVKGRLFHSGLPHKGINSIELGSEAMAYIQRRFYEDFPPVSLVTPLNPSQPLPFLSQPLPPFTLLVNVCV